MKQMHECRWKTCRKLIPINEKYCKEHKQKGEQLDDSHRGGYEKKYNQSRYQKNPLTANYHTKMWRKLRMAVLTRDNHLCQNCLRHHYIKPASHVDHIKPAIDYPDLFWDMDNLQSLCVECHTRKTNEEQRLKKRKNNHDN